MAALEEIDEACIVTTLDVPALHQAKQVIQTLLDGGYGKARIRLVLNRAPKRMEISPAELERCWAYRSSARFPRLRGALRVLRRRANAGRDTSWERA